MTKIGLVTALGSLLSLAACGGGDGDTMTNTTTTSSVATTTTTAASTTTTTIAPAAFTTAWRADNTPCVAPSDAQVSCEFVASTTGGQARLYVQLGFQGTGKQHTRVWSEGPSDVPM